MRLEAVGVALEGLDSGGCRAFAMLNPEQASSACHANRASVQHVDEPYMVVWLAKVEHHEYGINWGRWLVPSRGMLIPVNFNSRPSRNHLQRRQFKPCNYLLLLSSRLRDLSASSH